MGFYTQQWVHAEIWVMGWDCWLQQMIVVLQHFESLAYNPGNMERKSVADDNEKSERLLKGIFLQIRSAAEHVNPQ